MIVAAWVVGLTLGMGFPEWYFEWYPFIPIFFYVFGWFYIYMFDACRLFAPQRQQYVYLAMKGIKMIFSMGILLFYAVHVKEQKTEWISVMSKEINKISKASYSVPKATFELISSIYEWLLIEK